MRFLVRLVNQSGASSAERKQLVVSAYDAVRSFGADVGNLRVSSAVVELDLLVDSEDKLEESLKAIESKIGPLLTVRKLDVQSLLMEKAEAVRLGLSLFDEERYWESHEALESAWKQAEGDEREILQGLILIAASLVHWQKNEKQVTLSVMKRAREKLMLQQTEYVGVDLVALTKRLDGILRANEPGFFKLKAASS